jgi:hypothetical protein
MCLYRQHNNARGVFDLVHRDVVVAPATVFLEMLVGAPLVIGNQTMSTSFHDLFSGGQSQRRTFKFRVAWDDQGNMMLQPLEGQAHLISPDNSLDTIDLDPDAFFDGCNCNVKTNRAGAHCAEPGCSRVVCEKHLQYCAVCSKPLCLRCRYPIESAPGQQILLCHTHHREAVRRRFWRGLAKAALSPFVTFDQRDSTK